jgi:ribonuclease inhibitor
MKKYLLDCEAISSGAEFWDLYLRIVSPVGAGFFGRNLDAFWDATAGGGPGWPGNCQIVVVNTGLLAHRNGDFLKKFKEVARDIPLCVGVEVIFK